MLFTSDRKNPDSSRYQRDFNVCKLRAPSGLPSLRWEGALEAEPEAAPGRKWCGSSQEWSGSRWRGNSGWKQTGRLWCALGRLAGAAHPCSSVGSVAAVAGVTCQGLPGAAGGPRPSHPAPGALTPPPLPHVPRLGHGRHGEGFGTSSMSLSVWSVASWWEGELFEVFSFLLSLCLVVWKLFVQSFLQPFCTFVS